jgi:diguanylate cyclase (GGDEF)-like protein
MRKTLLHALLVEDNPTDAALICERLTAVLALTCRVQHVTQLHEALQCLQTAHFDVVLLDLSLPDAHGVETVQKMHAAAADTPVVVLTGFHDEDVALQAVSAGAQDYLCKDHVDGHGLVRAMRYAIERKRTAEALSRVNEQLAQRVAELERRNTEITLLNDMGELLQASQTVAEASQVIAQFTPRLFPAEAGAVYLLNADSALMEAIAVWGSGAPVEHALTLADCWALRRGRLHLVQGETGGMHCAHIAHPPRQTSTLCLPMIASGDMLGLLSLQTALQEPSPSAMSEGFSESRRQLALTFTKHVELALSNLKLRETLRSQSIHDPLTELFNRRYMEVSLQREIRRAIRHSTPVGVIIGDLDHFKQFNDTFGHLEGDRVLRAVGNLLKIYSRGEDIACRFGGEEFVLILPGASLEVTQQRAEQLRALTKNLQIPSHGRLLPSITLSVGVAVFPDHGASGEDLLRAADRALYRVKAAGRDGVMVADSGAWLRESVSASQGTDYD